jgi:hypothetical protein
MHGAIEFDNETKMLTVYELADLNNPKSQVIERQKYFPDCRVLVDGITQPNEMQMNNIRHKYAERKQIL